MVSIVVVSHSKKAAEGIRDVAQEMGGDATIRPVGGDPDGGIGTTAPAIEEAIREASDGSGDGWRATVATMAHFYNGSDC